MLIVNFQFKSTYSLIKFERRSNGCHSFDLLHLSFQRYRSLRIRRSSIALGLHIRLRVNALLRLHCTALDGIHLANAMQ